MLISSNHTRFLGLICFAALLGPGELRAGIITTDAVSAAFGCLIDNISCSFVSAQALYSSNSGAYFSTNNEGYGVTLTAGGSPNVLGLTSSSDESTASGLIDSSSANNAASLDSGTVAAQISSSGSNSDSEVADELAVYNLMFDVAGATPSTVTTVDVNLLITGSLSSSDDSSEDSVLTSFLGLEVGWNGAASPSFESGTSPNSNWTIGCFTTSCVSLQYAYTFTGPTGDFGLLDLENNAFQCMGGDACSESYNEAISLTLPSGVTYTSDSPTFLTASSAPEPGTLSLFALGGIAALIAMRLRLLGRRITV